MIASLVCTVLMSSSPSHLGPIPPPKGGATVGPGRVEGIAVNPIKSAPTGLGKWIWTQEQTESARFMKTVDIQSIPKKSIIRVTAECSYRLYLNDQIVARGPADVGRDYDIGPTGPWLYDVVDISKWIKKGQNTISVEVIQRQLVQSEGRLGKPGFWLEADLGNKKIGSDQTWLAASNPNIQFEKPTSGEPLSGKGEFLTLKTQNKPSDWQKEGEQWKSARLAKEAERPIQQSEIPAPLEAIYPATGVSRLEGGVQITGKPTFISNGKYSIKFDRVLSAHIVLRVNGGNGAILSLMPNERNAPGYHRAVRLKLDKGLQFFEVPFFDSFSTINIEATGVTEPIDVEEVSAVFRSCPVQYKGSFECSDPNLNEIWKVGRWSTQICMQTHHLDSPHHQEPISDPGDYLIESLISYNTFGEAGLAKQDLRKYAQIIRNRNGKVFHTSYALLWLQMLVEYWLHTGDDQLLKELTPTANQLIDTWETWRGSNDLISNPPNFMFIDWVELEGFNLHHPPAVIGQGVLTAFYYRALQDIGRISTYLKDNQRAERSRELQKQIREAFNRELWTADKGLYRDGKPGECKSPLGTWLPADKQIETFSSQVNILACAYGLAPENESAKIMNKVMESGPAHCQPYFMHFAFDALAASGLFNKWATPQICRWKIVPDTQTFPEMWDRGDLSHAWQCTPTYQLSSKVLGITPLTPGFKMVRIKPMICDLKWAKGSVPTPFGDVKVSWTRIGHEIKFDITIPKRANAIVELPDGSVTVMQPGKQNLSRSILQAFELK